MTLSRIVLSDTIRAEWPSIVAASGVVGMPTLPVGPLRGVGASAKTIKGIPFGASTAVMYGAPASSAYGNDPRKGNECDRSTPECRPLCLGLTSGRMVYRSVENSRHWKTALRSGALDRWYELLALDIDAHVNAARKAGLVAFVRCDGTTDNGDGEKLFPLFPGAQFYDYTKNVERAFRSLGTDYHVTLSYTGRNAADCRRYLRAGGNVAVVTDLAKGDEKPSKLWGFDCVDGDAHDIRPLDPPGTICVLSWKGPRSGLDIAGKFALRIRK